MCLLLFLDSLFVGVLQLYLCLGFPSFIDAAFIRLTLVLFDFSYRAFSRIVFLSLDNNKSVAFRKGDFTLIDFASGVRRNDWIGSERSA